MIEDQYQYLLNNNDFSEKQSLKSIFNDTLVSRLNQKDKFPDFYFLNNKTDVKLNDIIMTNKERDKAVFLLLSIGLDNQNAEMGGVNVISAKKENATWVFSNKIDMSFYYFTRHFDGELTFNKLSELSTKRMIKAGYMKTIDSIDYKYIENNWQNLFFK